MDAVVKVENLFKIHRKFDLSRFKELYEERFKEKYSCPSESGKCNGLKLCLEKHLAGKIAFRTKGSSIIALLKDSEADKNANHNMFGDEEEFPSLAVSAATSAKKKPSQKQQMKPVSAFRGFDVPSNINVNQIPKEGAKICENKHACTLSSNIPDPAPFHSHGDIKPLDSVLFSRTRRSVAFDFDLPIKPKMKTLTKGEVDERVNSIRNFLSKSGKYFDVYDLSRKLCEDLGVQSVQELRCVDDKRQFNKELDIPAIKEFSMTQRKVLCLIHSYCTAATIGTLHDLRDFICVVEKKDSFEELRLGPLEKFPLVLFHFQFPPDVEIRKLTVVQVMKHLWHYSGTEGKGKKIEIVKFLEYVAKKSGIDSVLETGVIINSIALAISVVKKTRFGDRDSIKKAEDDLVQSMNEDVENYIQTLRRGLTGKSNRTAHGQPENVIQKIAGMAMEDCIMEIFTFANNTKQKFKRQIATRTLLYGADMVIDIMKIFRGTPLLCKLFHVIVATGVFRKIGMDDYELLKILGFEDSLKKMTKERALEVMGGDGSSFSSQQPGKMGHGKVIVDHGKLVDVLVNWLKNASKPINVQTLSTIEHKVVQKFNATCFGDFGAGPLLEFIASQTEVQTAVGKHIVVFGGNEDDEEDTRYTRQKIASFALQCGSNRQERDVERAIRQQFEFARTWPRQRIIQMLKNSQNEETCNSRKITYLHALDCGCAVSSFANADEDLSNAHQDAGAIGHLTKQDAIRCLQSAPLLENLATWSCWNLVFEPQFGGLKSFVENTESVSAVETPTNQLLKISLDSSPDDLSCAINAGNPQETAGHVVSIIYARESISESPLIHMSNVVKSSLANRIAQDEESFSVERFVLECILKIPVTFCCSLVNQVFLRPLRELLGNDFGRCPVETRLLQQCRSNEEKSFLHYLGVVLVKREWSSDFSENRFRTIEPPTMPSSAKAVKPTGTNMHESLKPVEAETKNRGDNGAINDENNGTGDDTGLKETKDQCSEESKPESTKQELSSENDTSNGLTDEDDSSELENEEGEIKTVVGQLQDRAEHCKDLIDDIRRTEFGIGEVLDEKGGDLLRRNNDRLCRSLDRLSKELYAKDTHFVLELIQNADDNSYDKELMGHDSEEGPSVAFIVDQDSIVVLNNERGFEDSNIRAICDVGKSTKGAHRKGYIGQKGIGFKSVFRITDCPKIHSNGFHICFDAAEDKMGYICPQWCEDDSPCLQEYQPSADHCSIEINWKTKINLPLKKELANSMVTGSRFQDVHPSLLLFLNRIKVIIIDNQVNGKCLVMKKRYKGNSLVELTQNGIPSLWFVVTKETEINIGDEQKTTDLSLAFPISDVNDASIKSQAFPPQNVFAFLPLRSYGFKFLIQADFEVPSSREDIDRDSAWNVTLLSKIPQLVVDAYFKFRDSELDNDPTEALYSATRFFQYLPLESEIVGVFKPIARKIIQLLQSEDCIPIWQGNDHDKVLANERQKESDSNVASLYWAKPPQVLFGDSMLRNILSPRDLKRYLNLSYISVVMQQNVSPTLLKSLGVQSETLDGLIEVCKSHLKAIVQEKGKASEVVQWIGKWLVCVSRFLEKQYDASEESLQKIRAISVFPLSRGDLTSLLRGSLFFPLEKNNAKKSAKDNCVRVLEHDLNTLDRRIFDGLDQVDKLKLERFLSELGVKTFSPREAIKNHIIPTFKSANWHEKEHLVVPFLVYIKKQCCIEDNVVDIDALKEIIAIKTNRGIVKPLEQQIYFTPSYGNQYDLQAMFPDVEWLLLDAVYMEGRTEEIKSWREFFGLLRVMDFPIMRQKREIIKQNELASSPWGPIKPNWPSTVEDTYEISDLVCPELEQVLESKDHQQLLILAKLLDQNWMSLFVRNQSVPVRDAKGREIATTASSFLIKLKTKAWLPGNKRGLFKPDDLYLKTPEVDSLLASFCSYFSGDLNDITFINAIGIRNTVALDTIFRKLGEWSEDDTFATTLKHMTNVYNYIKAHLKDVDAADLSKPIIFVPEKPCKTVFLSRGKLLSKGEVCLYDYSKVMSKRSSLLTSKRQLLCQYYPKEVLEFFEKDMNIDKTPTLRDYINIAIAIAEDTRLPDYEAYNDLMAVFSQIGIKCVSSDHEEEFQDIVKSHDSTWERFDGMKDLFDFGKANFVYENLKDEKIIPTEDHCFSSPKEKPFLVDDPKLAKIFEKERSVHFVDTEGIAAKMEATAAKGDRDSRIKVKEERTRGAGILAFMAICKIDTVSQVFVPPLINPENSINGCPYWHKAFTMLLPYAQRFLRTNDKAKYECLLQKNFPELLKNLSFYTASSIIAVHTLRGIDNIFVQVSRKCAVELTEKGIHFYIGRDAVHDKEDVISEFVALFELENKDLADRCIDLLVLLESMIQGDSKPEAIEQRLKRKNIPKPPENEPVWALKESEDLKVVEIKQQSSASEREANSSDAMTCWPPRAPEVGVGSLAKPPQSHMGAAAQTQWPPLPPVELTLSQFLTEDTNSRGKNSGMKLASTDSDDPRATTATRKTAAPTEATTATKATATTKTTEVARKLPKSEQCVTENAGKAKTQTEASRGATTGDVRRNSSDEVKKKISPDEAKEDTRVSESVLVVKPQNQDLVSVQPRNHQPGGITPVQKKNSNIIYIDNNAGPESIPLNVIAHKTVTIDDREIEGLQIPSNLDEKDTTAVGRYGEQIVYSFMKRKYESEEIEVFWINEVAESKQPFDILIVEKKTNRVLHYIEVKSSTSIDPSKPFEISPKELEVAFNNGETFHLYRVSGIGNSVVMYCFERLKQHLHQGGMKIFLVY
ncbi:uncharacterized protein LOC135687459 [Rhopilema esculentum]|uniref:uncharacterized protein LOC135687459 n=1 Tax=Rhopilema esculentum TaxID=499914 RepID=UPI0031E46DB7